MKYNAIYPGIDLVYYGSQSNLESDYVLAPHADPKQIKMHIEGASKLYLDSQGNLVVSTRAGDLLLHKPRAYQHKAGSQQEIAANYIQRGHETVGIQLATYDTTQPLIIDPVLSYSTYLGGTANQVPTGIAADSAGFAYVTGYTNSPDFHTTAGSLRSTRGNNPSYNVFVTKIKQDGTGLVYSTFVGGTGSGSDTGSAIAIDAAGDAYITGSTSSTDFPITTDTALQRSNKGNNGFFTKLDPTGSILLYSTFLGGAIDSPNAIAIDSNFNAYITGTTTSTDFPLVTATALQTTNKSNSYSTLGTTFLPTTIGTAFLSRIDPTKSGVNSLVYSTYLGGSNQDDGLGIAVDAAFNAYIVGYTSSPDFPQPAAKNGFQTILRSSQGNAFVARIDTTKPALLVYSTFLGGSAVGWPAFYFGGASDAGTAIAVPPAGGSAYVAGFTFAADFPTAAALDTGKNPNGKSFVACLDTTKAGSASLPFSNYLGGIVFAYRNDGTIGDRASGIAVDSDGNIYVTGFTSASDFPVTPGAPQVALRGFNAYLTELNPAGSAIIFSTYLGGGNGANTISLDGASPPNAYIAGWTSATLPTTLGAFQTKDLVVGTTNLGGANTDGFVAKISAGAVTGVFAAPTALPFTNQTINAPTPPKNATLFNNSSTALSNIAISFTGPNASDFTQAVSTCGATLAANSSCLIGINFTPSTVSSETATLSITDSDASSPQTVALTATRAPVLLTPAVIAFGNLAVTESLPQTVNLTNFTPVTLNGVAISIAGPSAASFTVTGPNPLTGRNEFASCGPTLAPGTSCSFDVVFAPTAAGAATATLSVADSDASSPQTVGLTGGGSIIDFRLAVSPATVTVTAGSTATTTAVINTTTDLRAGIGFTCTGAPVGATCTVSPSPANITEDGSGYLPSTVTITTTSRSIVAPPLNSLREDPPYPLVTVPIAFALFLIAALVVRRQPANWKLAWTFSLLIACVTGCGGGSGGAVTGTPAGTYQLTVTGVDSTARTRQATFSLTVN